MIREVIVVGDERLATPCNKVEDIESIRDLIQDLKDTVNNPEKMGLGLAAPQLGELQAVFVIRTGLDSRHTPMLDKEIQVIINPEIKKVGKKLTIYREGCISVPDKVALTSRYKEIKVKYMNETGKYVTETFRGTNAIVFQHEFAHLTGRTILEDAQQVFDIPKKDPLVSEEDIKGTVYNQESNTGFEDIEVTEQEN